MITVVEKFRTIQGEGKYAGYPVTFIRLMNCGLHCSFCDTKYTWNPKYNIPKNTKLEYLNTKLDVDNFIKENKNMLFPNDIANPNIVISGGEPLIESNFKDGLLKHLINNLAGCNITFETTTLMNPLNDLKNSTITNNMNKIFDLLDGTPITLSISPKFPLNCYPKGITYENIYNYYTITSKDLMVIPFDVDWYYKFVFHKTLERYIKPAIENITPLVRNRIYLMPLTPNRMDYHTDKNHYFKNCMDTYKFCVDNNLIYGSRIHVDLFGLKTGV